MVNFLDQTPPLAGYQLAVDDYKAAHPAATHRTHVPCITYNCHGLTFAARRSEILEPEEVRKILEDDGYVNIQKKNVLPGDIVLYYKDGDLIHSGIIVERLQLTFRVLSKWGNCQEVVHWLADCPYNALAVEFYRISG